ncbi:uncharacterized protein LOC129593094 [Paramacrobiotus metropolitanus]|uniref:uncharacterized protein LOC129593094 n=1 Tax=Paramacrobiotus metropolitanus TaxID=2943436 RepID=UPI0024457663|nr:uncharacterized protein LOC129593094 [Paramacrobiotus metropolitanus]
MAGEALPITPACLHSTAWLFEVSIEQFKKTYQPYTTTYTATVKLDTEHVQKYFGIPASLWKVSVMTTQSSSVATYQIGLSCAKQGLTSKESLRVECSISGSGLHFGDPLDLVIGPEGWACHDLSARTLSFPLPLVNTYDYNNRQYHYTIAPGSTVYVRLAFYATESDGSSLGSCRDNLVEKLGTLLESGRTNDCTLVSRDGKHFAVHRAVLVAQSPVFAAMFKHDMKEKSSGKCFIKDISGMVLGALIKFAYTCAPLTLPAAKLPDLYDAADKYDMADLRVHCENVMIGAIDVNIALRYVNFAKERGLKKLKKQAIKFLYEHSDEI